MMKVDEFIEKLKLAERSKTIYIKGCFGAPMTSANKRRYTNNLKYNANRAYIINAVSVDTFGFDCVCLIKGILWGWNADSKKNYGGAVYKSNGVPDVGADAIVKYLQHVSTDFSSIIPGEVVWLGGHVGVYVGDGQVIECSPSWENRVQYTNLRNLGYQEGHSRQWLKHGRLPWVEYISANEEEKPVNEPSTQSQTYVVKKGDTLSKIAKANGTTIKSILELNPAITNPNKIFVGQTIRLK